MVSLVALLSLDRAKSIQYVMSLANDDNVDEVRFQLPMSVGERYGTPPPELELARSHSAHTRIRLTAEIQTSGRIQRITSPSHQADISEVVYLTHHGRPSHRRSTIKFKSYSFLERDFILIIQAEALDTPRCFAEIKHDLDGRGSATIAMQLTMVPKFDLPPIREQEYFFVVDRSGSMDGDRISTARRTLAILLRMLPSQRTMFNIFSFGNRVDPLWPRSRRYDQSSLDVAVSELMVSSKCKLMYREDCFRRFHRSKLWGYGDSTGIAVCLKFCNKHYACCGLRIDRWCSGCCQHTDLQIRLTLSIGA